MLLRFNLLLVYNLYEVLLVFSTITIQFLIYAAAEAAYNQKLCESSESKIKTLIIISRV